MLIAVHLMEMIANQGGISFSVIDNVYIEEGEYSRMMNPEVNSLIRPGGLMHKILSRSEIAVGEIRIVTLIIDGRGTLPIVFDLAKKV